MLGPPYRKIDSLYARFHTDGAGVITIDEVPEGWAASVIGTLVVFYTPGQTIRSCYALVADQFSGGLSIGQDSTNVAGRVVVGDVYFMNPGDSRNFAVTFVISK